MPNYAAPVEDLRFVLNELVDLAKISKMPGYEAVSYTHLTLPTILRV